MHALVAHLPYLLFVFLAVVGIYIVVTHRNLLHSMIGLYVFQSSVILFFVLLGVHDGGTIPILPHDGPIPAMMNPLPHAMMLTAIVVGVATLGVALALMRRIHQESENLADRQPEDAP